ncbi:MAG: hypothetical protein K0R34_1533 [Herbinix sp.]|jgi:hypothetical protein|nr:hypothetical protein [Herbinix sp.]
MAKYEQKLSGDFDNLILQVHEGIMQYAVSMNLVDQSDYQSGDIRIAVRVYDKYFMRNGNRTSLSLTIVGHGEDLFVSAISAGGGQGILFNTSWGAEEDMVFMVQELVESKMQ